MKNLVLMLFLVCLSKGVFAQDVYKKRYRVTDSIIYITVVKKDEIGKNGNFEKQKRLGKSKIVKAKQDTIITHTVLRNSLGEPVNFDSLHFKGNYLKANIAFGEKDESHKLFVNPWLIRTENSTEIYFDRDSIYHFKLKNRQSIRIKFRQWSLNALTVPLKIRFGNETKFTTGANLGAILGYTWGKTNFVHYKKVGNKTYDSKWTLGLFLGADKLEFAFSDNSNTDIEVSTALLSSGLGFLYSYQNFTIGLTGGFDFALGENGTEWDYHGKSWLGISLGYSLFSF